MSNPSDTTSLRELRIVQDVDRLTTVVFDKGGTRALAKQHMKIRLVLAVFAMTLVLFLPAIIVLFVHVGRAARCSSWRIEATPTAVRISRVFTIAEPDAAQTRAKGSPLGPGFFGRGAVPPPLLLPYAELQSITCTDFSLVLTTHAGVVHEILMELTKRQDIERLADKLRAVHHAHRRGLTTSQRRSKADLAALHKATLRQG